MCPRTTWVMLMLHDGRYVSAAVGVGREVRTTSVHMRRLGTFEIRSMLENQTPFRACFLGTRMAKVERRLAGEYLEPEQDTGT